MRCPQCGRVYPADPDTNFCELDGASLVTDSDYAATALPVPVPVESTSGCAPGACIDDGDGYCAICGRKITPTLPDEAIALPQELAPAPYLGAVTDRGKRHPTNQDAVAVTLGSANSTPDISIPIVVICDGVSSARHSEVAAATATQTTLKHLQGYVSSSRLSTPTTHLVDLDAATIADTDPTMALLTETPAAANPPFDAMRMAIIAAHQAVCALDDAPDDTLEAPGCTIIAAIVEPAQLTIGWVGDSRAYILAGDRSRLLTRDHSYVNELIARGEMTEGESTQSRFAHVITLCLGPLNSDALHPPEPAIVQIPHDAAGLLVLCSDGLWNYAPRPDVLAALAEQAGPNADAQTIAHHLASFANTRGGLDNITVAVVRLEDLSRFHASLAVENLSPDRA